MHKMKKTPLEWKRDDSKYTKEELAIIDFVAFPNRVPSGNVLQKRIARKDIGEGFTDRENLTIHEIRYGVCSYKSAMVEVGQLTLQTHDQNGRELIPELKEQAKKSLQRVMKSKSRKHIYFTPDYVQAELDDLLLTYALPKPTKSMKVEDDAEEVAEVKAEKSTKLTSHKKGKARVMFHTDKKDVNEIARELDLTDVNELIAYLKDSKPPKDK